MEECHKQFCHEIRTHLQTISGYSELIQLSTDMIKIQDYNKKLFKAVQKINSICSSSELLMN